jgi:hypothetical protein
MARAPEEEGSMGSVDAITAFVYPASAFLLQCLINELHGFLRLEFQPENNISCTVKLHTELD